MVDRVLLALFLKKNSFISLSVFFLQGSRLVLSHVTDTMSNEQLSGPIKQEA